MTLAWFLGHISINLAKKYISTFKSLIIFYLKRKNMFINCHSKKTIKLAAFKAIQKI